MDPATQPSSDIVERAAFVHREIIQISLLGLAAIAAFVLTREVAISNRQMSLRDAAEWYRQGQQAIAAGRVDVAIDALRRARVRDRSNKRYVLALAQALAKKGDTDGALSELLALRESSPDDPEINLELARLSAGRSDVTEALRFYHNALYAPWPAEQADTRRGVRLELIRLLITHDQSSRALSELVALSTDLPDDVPLLLEVAQLFVKAGDNGHALNGFQRVLRLAPENGEALGGAGQAAFRLGGYAQAGAYLRRAPAGADEVRSTREVVDLLLSNDPMASRLGSAERRRRLNADLSYARQRMSLCLEQPASSQPISEAPDLQTEARAVEGELRRSTVLGQDTVESGVALIDRIERLVVQKCGTPTALDQALLLIGRQHGADTR